jgi:hypothetical protein
MRKEDVPQDAAILEQQSAISYAVDGQGRYVLTPSAGWDPSNLANTQAWQLIAEEIEAALSEIRSGKASPLLFHMVRHQMDAALLARYARLARWRVKRHLRVKPYRKLTADLRRRYAAVFGIAADRLDLVPERVELPVAVGTAAEGTAPL